ncbi:MAG: hypothetical protein Kow0099_38770 [Candidatus Abyssubacteria bacterium]
MAARLDSLSDARIHLCHDYDNAALRSDALRYLRYHEFGCPHPNRLPVGEVRARGFGCGYAALCT